MKHLFTLLLAIFSLTAFNQNVGIGTDNPNQKLHLKNDTSDLGVLFQSKIFPATVATYDTSLNGTIGSINNNTKGYGTFPWETTPISAITNSDDVWLKSAKLTNTPGYQAISDTLSLTFDFSSNPIPASATVNYVKFYLEHKIIDSFSGVTTCYHTAAHFTLNDIIWGSNKAWSSNLSYVILDNEETFLFSAKSGLTPANLNNGEVGFRIAIRGSVSDTNNWVQMLLDHAYVVVEAEVPLSQERNSSWIAGVSSGEYAILKGKAFGVDPAVRVTGKGKTVISDLQIPSNSAIGKVLTSDNNGNAEWRYLNEYPLDFDPSNETQYLSRSNDSLYLKGVNEEGQRDTFSIVPLDWTRKGEDVYRPDGNVGIGLSTPQNRLHIKEDSTPIVMTYTNLKATSIAGVTGGTSEGEVNSISTGTSLNNAWPTSPVSSLTTSDNTRLQGAEMESDLPYGSYEYTDSLFLGFDFSADPVPPNAIITGIEVMIEGKNETYRGYMYEKEIRLTNNGSVSGANRSNSFLWTYVDYKRYYGGSSDLWNTTLTPGDVNSGSLGLMLQFRFLTYPPYYPNYYKGRALLDAVKVKIYYSDPVTVAAPEHWSTGIKDGEYRIANGTDLNNNVALKVTNQGVTQMRQLQMTENAGNGKVLTSDKGGTAYWTDASNLSLDNDPANEFQILTGDGDTLRLLGIGESGLDTFNSLGYDPSSDNEIQSLVFGPDSIGISISNSKIAKSEINYWNKSGDSLATAKLVGIGRTDPKTSLHINGAITMDSVSYDITANNATVTVGNRSCIFLNSNAIAANRNVGFSDGLSVGQWLTVVGQATGGNAVTLTDNSAGPNMNLISDRILESQDVIQLLWDGNDWIEVSFSDN